MRHSPPCCSASTSPRETRCFEFGQLTSVTTINLAAGLIWLRASQSSASACCSRQRAYPALCFSRQVPLRTLLPRSHAPLTFSLFLRSAALAFRFPSVNSDHDATAIPSATEQGRPLLLPPAPSAAASLSPSSRPALRGKSASIQLQSLDARGPRCASASSTAFRASGRLSAASLTLALNSPQLSLWRVSPSPAEVTRFSACTR